MDAGIETRPIIGTRGIRIGRKGGTGGCRGDDSAGQSEFGDSHTKARSGHGISELREMIREGTTTYALRRSASGAGALCAHSVHTTSRFTSILLRVAFE